MLQIEVKDFAESEQNLIRVLSESEGMRSEKRVRCTPPVLALSLL